MEVFLGDISRRKRGALHTEENKYNLKKKIIVKDNDTQLGNKIKRKKKFKSQNGSVGQTNNVFDYIVTT